MQKPGDRAKPFVGPLHGILLAFPVALFPAALVSDIAYLQTSVVQWTNFSQWLIAGADVFAGLLLATALLLRFFGRLGYARGRATSYLVVVALMFAGGVVNAFQHAKDGWASVGTTGLVLSLACAVLALIAAFLAHSTTIVRKDRP